MANYESCITTNYFQVTSEQELKDLVSQIDCPDEIEISSSTEKGKTYYSLCAYESFCGVNDNEDIEELYKEFQRILSDGEVLVLFEIGNENLVMLAGILLLLQIKPINQNHCITLLQKWQELSQTIPTMN